jgi:hypothetical protein
MQNTSEPTHNLDIQNYSFHELLGLFDLTTNMNLSDLKRAKRKVLFLHPDKSHLSPQYFLFYKRAFEIIVEFYQERTKQDREIPKEPIRYNPMVDETSISKKMMNVVQQYQFDSDAATTATATATDATSKSKHHEFQRTFNELFEKNMAKRPNPTQNQWFQDSDPIFQHDQVTNQANMGNAMQTIKSKVSTLSKYRGVEEMRYNNGASFYDEDDNIDNSDYITTDVFSKLKYDDLRKVHKDQTVFAVSEHDYDPSKRAHNIDHLSKERNTQDLTPLEKSQAESILETQKREFEKRMFQRQHDSRLRTIEYERKNKDVMGAFLRLQL